MPHTQRQNLEILKLQKEIEKLEIEKRELRRGMLKFYLGLSVPVVIAITSAIVVIKSNLFQDLQVKIENQKAELKKETSDFEVQKGKILREKVSIIADTTRLGKENRALSRSNFFLDSVNKDYQKQGNKTLANLSSRYLVSQAMLDNLRKDSVAKTVRLQHAILLTDSLSNALFRANRRSEIERADATAKGGRSVEAVVKNYLSANSVNGSIQSSKLVDWIQDYMSVNGFYMTYSNY